MTLLDCKDDKEDDDGVADAPPRLPAASIYGLINKFTMAGGGR